jgi:O-antigen/teichoic acid export membrane protein
MLSDQFIPLVLGEEYTESAAILQTVAWVILLIFVNWGISNALISVNREKTYLRIVVIVTVFNLGANLGLIPAWGAFGAVVASLLTESLMLFIQSYVLSKSALRLPLSLLAFKPVLSVGIMAVSVHFTRDIGMVTSILVAANV